MIKKLIDFVSLEKQGQIFKTFCEQIEMSDVSTQFFKNGKPNLTQKDFVKIEDLHIDFTCQRNPFRKERISRMRKIAKHYNPLKVKRAQLAKIDGDPLLYVWDAFGRTIIAHCLGFEYIPADICHFRDKNEMREFFLDQDTLDEKIHNWERHEIILKFKKEECPKRFVRFYNQALDIQNVIDACNLSIWTRKSQSHQMSAEKIWGYIKKCITNLDISGNGATKAGERNSLNLKAAISILQNKFANEAEIGGQIMEAMVAFINNEIDSGQTPDIAMEKINFIIDKNQILTQREFKEAIEIENVANSEISAAGVRNIALLFQSTRKKHPTDWQKLLSIAA